MTEGEHTRVKTVVTAKIGGLAKFTKKVATCIGCKSVIPKDLGLSDYNTFSDCSIFLGELM